MDAVLTVNPARTLRLGNTTKGDLFMPASKRRSHGRELINTGSDKRYVRRDNDGRLTESDDQGKSLRQDRRTRAKKTVTSGQGDRGDQKRR